jgi:hypothetical protein
MLHQKQKQNKYNTEMPLKYPVIRAPTSTHDHTCSAPLPLKTPAKTHFNYILRPNTGIEMRQKFLTTNDGKGCMNDISITTHRGQYTYQ